MINIELLAEYVSKDKNFIKELLENNGIFRSAVSEKYVSELFGQSQQLHQTNPGYDHLINGKRIEQKDTFDIQHTTNQGWGSLRVSNLLSKKQHTDFFLINDLRNSRSFLVSEKNFFRKAEIEHPGQFRWASDYNKKSKRYLNNTNLLLNNEVTSFEMIHERISS